MALESESARRWRLVLGGDESDGIGCALVCYSGLTVSQRQKIQMLGPSVR
jgi:hypothetical protein